MAQDFLPVGIEATVVGVDKFLGDLRRMQKGVTDFGKHVRASGIHLDTFTDGLSDSSTQARAFTGVAKSLADASNNVGSSVQNLSSQISELGLSLKTVAPRAAQASAALNNVRTTSTSLQGAIERTTAKLQSQVQAAARNSQTYRSLQASLQQTQKKADEYRIKLASAQRAQDSARGSTTKLAEKWASLRKENLQLNAQVVKQQGVLNSATKALSAHGNEVQHSRASLAEFVTSAANARAKLANLGGEIEKNKAKTATARAAYLQAAQGLAQLTQRTAQTRVMLGLLDGRAVALAAKMNKIVLVAKLAANGIKAFGFALRTGVGAVKLMGSSIVGLINGIKRLNKMRINGVNKVKKWNNTLKNTASRAFRVGNSIRFLGTSLTFLVSLPIIGFFKKMTGAALEFEDAWAGVIRTVDDPALGDTFKLIDGNNIKDLTAAGENLRQGFRNLSLDIPVTSAELAKLGEIAGTLGVRGNQNLITFVETAARLGATTNVSSEEAATALAKIQGVAGGLSDAELELLGYSKAEIVAMSASERFQVSTEALGGVLTDLGNKTRAQEDEILDFSQKIAATGNIIGLTSSEMLAFSAAFEAVGVDVSRGGTAFQKTITTMLTAVEEGGPKLDIFAATAGESVDKFSKLFRDDASEAIRQFIEGLGQSGTQAVSILGELDLADARVQQSILALASAEGELTQALQLSNGELINQATGLNALLTESERRFSTTQNQIQLLKNQFTDLGVTVGSIVLPWITELVQKLRRLIEVFANLDEGMQKFIIIAGILVAAIGPIVTFTGLAIATIGFLASTIFSAIGVILSLASSLGLLFAPIAAVVLAIAGLAIAFAASFKKMKTFAQGGASSLAQSMFGFGRNIIIAFARGMATAIIAVVQVLNELGKVISKWLKPGSPPKILPDLDKWGTGAAQSYMDGWLAADFDVFNKIADKVETFIRSVSDATDQAGKQSMIERIIGSRKAIGRATDEIKRLGKVTSSTMNSIYKAMGATTPQVRRFIEAMIDVKAATQAVEAAQARVNAITERYAEALEPIEERLKQISRRQQEISDRDRVIELEAVLADPRAPELVRELANLEIEQIGLEADARGLESARDAELAVAEASLEASQAKLDAAEQELAAAEALLDVTIKEQELLNELKEAAKSAAGSIKDAAGSLADAIEGFDPSELELPGFDPEDGGLINDLIGDLDITSIADTISDAFGELIADIKAEFAPLIGDDGLFNQLGETWAPIFDTIAEKLGQFKPSGDGLLGFLSRVQEKTDDFARGLARFVDGGLTEFFSVLVDLGLIEPFGPLVDKAKETEGPLSKIGQIVEDIKEFFGQLGATIGEVIDRVAGFAPIKAAIEGIEPALAAFKVAWDNITEVIGPIVTQFIDTIKNSELLRGVLKLLVGALKVLGTLLGVVILFIFVEVLAGITGLVNGIARALAFMSPFIATLLVGITRWWSGFIQVLDGVWQIVSGIIELIVNIFEWAFGGDSTGVQESINKITNGFSDLVSGVIAQVTGLVEAIYGLIGGLVAGIFGLVDGFVSGVVDFFKSMYNTLVGNSIVVDLVNDILGLFAELVTKGIEAIVSFVDGIVERLSTFKDIVVEHIEAGLAWLADLPGKMLDFGKNAIQGFIDGLLSTDIGAKVFEIGGNILGSIKGALGIQSPSKEMESVGKDTIEGWIRGVEANLRDVTKLFRAAVEDSVDAIATMHQLIQRVSSAEGQKEIGLYQALLEKIVGMYEIASEAILATLAEQLNGSAEFFSTMLRITTAFGNVFSIGKTSAWGLIVEAALMWWELYYIDLESTWLPDILELIAKFTERMLKLFIDKLDNFRSVGTGIINSILGGLNSAAPGLFARANEIANEIRRTIEDALEFGSPSKVFLEIGAGIIDSWVLGMQRERSSLLANLDALTAPFTGTSQAREQQASAVYANRAPRASQAQLGMTTGGTVNNVNVDLGGQTINNGMNAFDLQIIIEQAVKRAIG